MEYIDFLKSKQIATEPKGFYIPPEKLNPKGFEWQNVIVSWALKKGRAALFEDCGLGKTYQQLEFAHRVNEKTNKPVLILAPFGVTGQTVREGEKFGIKVKACRSQYDIVNGVNIANYEILGKFSSENFGGIVLDESSILKSYMGKQKRQIIDFCQSIEYRLACTATPAPNDHMELLNHAEFLGIMKSSEALSVWFIADQSQSGKYRLKGHAIKPFWQWVSTWAVNISNPADIGYSDERYTLPKLNEVTDIVKISELDETFENGLFRKIDMSATSYHKEKRLTAELRAKRCAEIVKTNEQFVVWCETNYEADYLKKYIPEAVEIRGSDKPEHKEKAALDFIDGNIKTLISKPSILGFGLNFQNCHNTVFCGRDFSFEKYYQALRRFWRFGQTKPVNAYSVLGSTEQFILQNVQEKARKHDEMQEQMSGAIKNIQLASLKGHRFKLTLESPEIKIPEWLKGA